VSTSLSSRCVGALLRSRAHRLLDGQLVLLTYRGRRSGDEHSVPVAYARDGDDVVLYAGHHETKQWWRNFEQPEHVRLRLRGAACAGVACVARTDRATRDAYERRFPRAARAIDREHVPVFVRVTDVQPVTAGEPSTRGVTA
jgi:hypothetical protein